MEAYWWLRDHTPEDARVMAWWDYGYQITKPKPNPNPKPKPNPSP